MRPFDDGRIDARSPIRCDVAPASSRTAEAVRLDVDAFRGRILSLAYGLERRVDAVIVWHLFRDRDDGMAGVFEEDVLHGGFGLERKVRLAAKIAEHWLAEDNDPAGYAKALAEAKSYRDRAAHWPTRLVPIETTSGETVDYLPILEKGADAFGLTTDVQTDWVTTIERVTQVTGLVASRIEEYCRIAPD